MTGWPGQVLQDIYRVQLVNKAQDPGTTQQADAQVPRLSPSSRPRNRASVIGAV